MFDALGSINKDFVGSMPDSGEGQAHIEQQRTRLDSLSNKVNHQRTRIDSLSKKRKVDDEEISVFNDVAPAKSFAAAVKNHHQPPHGKDNYNDARNRHHGPHGPQEPLRPRNNPTFSLEGAKQGKNNFLLQV